MRFVTYIFLALALTSHAFAVLRPRHPAKPRAPFRGDSSAVGDNSIGAPPANAPSTAAK